MSTDSSTSTLSQQIKVKFADQLPPLVPNPKPKPTLEEAEEKRKLLQKEYRKNNPQIVADWRLRNKERVLAYSKLYYDTHKDAMLEKQKLRREAQKQANKEIRLEKKRLKLEAKLLAKQQKADLKALQQ